MGMKVNFNPEVLEMKISQIGERAVKGMADRMRKHAILIRDLARDYAPVDSGLLERSIDYRVIRANRRNAYVVFIDLDALNYQGREPKPLGDYAFIMEEELHPYGRQRGPKRFNLGVRSKEKAKTGRKVGGKFLSRAIKDGTKTIMKDMLDEVRRSIKGGSSVGVQYKRDRGGEE